MKKLFALLTILTLSSTTVFAATNYASTLKNAVKQDIQNAKQANQEAQQSAAQAKKEQKMKEIDAKLDQLNKDKKSVQESKNITETQRTLQLSTIQKQIDFYTKQKAALK